MRYLFVHDAFPGQFVHLLRTLARDRSNEIVAASREGSTTKLPIKQIVYSVAKEAQDPDGKPVFGMEAQGLGYDLYSKLKPLAEQGWVPDNIIVHASRGASFFLRDLFPDARIICFLEWYYASCSVSHEGSENMKKRLQAVTNNHIKSMPIVRDFEQSDACYTPTVFQRDQFPAKWHSHITVQHEGVDSALYRPVDDQTFEIDGVSFDQSMEVITYAARGMEHSRGFPQFMQAIAKLQKRRPHVHVLIAAADRICYDAQKSPKGLRSWAEESVDYDPTRTHFVGLLPEKQFARMLQVSSVHAYLSIPFVLSWSCLNAMSTGICVLASDTAPVREVIKDGVNGYLVDMYDIDAIADRMDMLLDSKQKRLDAGIQARKTILEKYDIRDCTQRLLALINGNTS